MSEFDMHAPARRDAPDPGDATPGREVWGVTALTRSIRQLLESRVGEVWVEGEISNHRLQGSGHQYFTLKDERAQLSCVLFRGAPGARAMPLSDGLQILAFGRLTVYEPRGQYQLNVQLVQPRGAGALQARFEALKRKLQEEGLFDPDRKRPLPAFPTRIALITSPTGAAVRDMLNVLSRRAPWLHISIVPVKVQGEGAAAEIAAALRALSAPPGSGVPHFDLAVLARGGGSIEDLWAFNEEIVARAIFASRVPVVSAVGHEIDFTIADFVADLRAPTPSAAAELVAPDSGTMLRHIRHLGTLLRERALARLDASVQSLGRLSEGTLRREPRRRVDEARQRVDHLAEALALRARMRLDGVRHRLVTCQQTLRAHRPQRALEARAGALETLRARLVGAAPRALERIAERHRKLRDLLGVLGPEATLRRGFTLTTLDDGTLIPSATAVPPGATIRTRFHDGEIGSVVPR